MIKALLLALTLASPALAETQDEVLSATLLPGWQMENGHHMAGVSLSLAPEWKTYWRSPGDAGIPPLFDWSGSQNVKSLRVLWPSPQVFHTNGLQTIGYHDAVTLPVEVTPLDPSKPVHLSARVDLGICKDICMPAEVALKGDLTTPGAPDRAIRAALNALPVAGKAAGLKHIACRMTPIKDGVQVVAELTLARQGPEETVVFEAKDPQIWVSEASSSRAGNVLTARADFVSGSGAPFALQRSGVRVTVLSAAGSVEIAGCPAP
ncbi:MAG: protein-disulfide reductase DsbD domain-containing protein [Cypionkella sp.]